MLAQRLCSTGGESLTCPLLERVTAVALGNPTRRVVVGEQEERSCAELLNGDRSWPSRCAELDLAPQSPGGLYGCQAPSSVFVSCLLLDSMRSEGHRAERLAAARAGAFVDPDRDEVVPETPGASSALPAVTGCLAFSSGSHARPKGIIVQRGLVHFLDWERSRIGNAAGGRARC